MIKKNSIENPHLMSIIADIFMLSMIEIGDVKATSFNLPRELQKSYASICNSVDADAKFSLDNSTEGVFNLEFKNSAEQDKVWLHFYEFNHSGKRTFPRPNVFDQSNGEILISKLNDYIKRAVLEFINPTYQYLLTFNLFDFNANIDLISLNQKFKLILGSGIKYVMAWDSETNLPMMVMIEGIEDPTPILQKFRHLIYETSKSKDDEISHEWRVDFFELLNPISISVDSKFEYEDQNFWQYIAAKMALIN